MKWAGVSLTNNTWHLNAGLKVDLIRDDRLIITLANNGDYYGHYVILLEDAESTTILSDHLLIIVWSLQIILMRYYIN